MLIFKSQYSENYEELPFRIKETGEKHKNYSKLINVDLNLAEGTNVEAYIKKSDITECNITTQVIGNKSEDALSLYKNGEIVKHLANISSSKKFLINTTNKITELISKNNSFIPIIYEDKNYDINLKLIEDFDISIENNNTNNFVSVGSFIGHGTEIRPSAFIRGSVLIGDNCVIGGNVWLTHSVPEGSTVYSNTSSK